jgi:hypothetical protein
VKVEFYRVGDEERITLAEVAWADGTVDVRSDDEELVAKLRYAFRRTPVVTDDAAFRRLGTRGEVVLQPGDLEWFRAAALGRATAETGLAATVVPGGAGGGYDPAADYRPFGEKVERLSSGSNDGGTDLRP